ncbi:MAG: alpha/beta hydrolase [Pirellulales bacterium]|nr:alpha/beta hydrolase [Pirellulales bacterium]
MNATQYLLPLSLAMSALPRVSMAQDRRPADRPRVPVGVRAEFDVPYADTDNPQQKLDLYLPDKPIGDGPLPVVVWIHGGAWRAGNKSSGLGNLATLVASGRYAGVSVAYRLTDEAVWPAQIHDCKAALRWIRAHAQQHNLDPKRIGVWGSSAGGHLVAMLGTSGGVKPLEGELGEHIDQGSRVTCVVDYFGPSDMLTMGKYPSRMDHDSPNSPESRLVGGPVQEAKEAARSASPTTYVSQDDPPFLIVHGDQDPLVPHNQSVRLADLLEKAGVDVTFITITGGGHGGFRSLELTGRVRRFLDKHLRGQQVEISAAAIPQGRRE